MNRGTTRAPAPLTKPRRESCYNPVAEIGRRAWGKHLETQIVGLANSTKDERLRFEILKYLYDRHAGKPYIAINPAERKGRTMVQDNRLQLAIHHLIIEPQNATVEPTRQLPEIVEASEPPVER